MAGNAFSNDPLPAGARIACRVEYDGSRYHGWQSQLSPGVHTVQQMVELSLSTVADAPVRVHCAGRTDAGVHAHAQVIHLDAPVSRSSKEWVVGGNTRLPPDIRLHWAIQVPSDFHARFSAKSRCYRYVIANTPVCPALLLRQVAWHRKPLDTSAMCSASQALLGEQDFTTFQAASCQSPTPMREVHSVAVSRCGDLVVIEIRANAFLHHMVRNIVGSLLAVGDGRQPPSWIAHLLARRNRAAAAETAPAHGLYLVDVTYPEAFGLPVTPLGPLLLVAAQ